MKEANGALELLEVDWWWQVLRMAEVTAKVVGKTVTHADAVRDDIVRDVTVETKNLDKGEDNIYKVGGGQLLRGCNGGGP